MANFNALSSVFVFATMLLLLLGITSYPTGAATTTEIAGDDVHEIRARVLQGSATKVYRFFFKAFSNGLKQFQQPPGSNFNLYDYYAFVDGICTDYRSYCYPNYHTYECNCNWNNPKQAPGTTGNPCQVDNFYCCQATNGTCTKCCTGNTPDGKRYYVGLPSYALSSSSAGSPWPVAYGMAVIAVMQFTLGLFLI